MVAPPFYDILPENEQERLEALQAYELLYTAAEEAFDNITEIMAQVFGAPMSFISLIDKDTVFYKSQAGPFGRNTVRRQDSFCSLTILDSKPFVVEDAAAEERFAGNPFVAQEGGIRFYAGAPLMTREGYHIGTACIVDTKSRAFSEADKRL